MPMMRRGPLDRYPVEWVLRQASAHQASGSIEFNAPQPITVYLHGGRIYHAVRGIVADGEAPASIDLDHGEAEARAAVVDVIATALGTSGGWYYHDPLGRHDDRGPWLWETASVLMDARVRSHDDDSLGRWATTQIGLHLPSTPVPVTLGPDAWAVVVALAEAADAPDVRTRLGWTADRLIAALDDLADAGALRPQPGTARAATATATSTATADDPEPQASVASAAPTSTGPPSAAGSPSGAVRADGRPPAAPARPHPTPRPSADGDRPPTSTTVTTATTPVPVLAHADAEASAPPAPVRGPADPLLAADLGGRHPGPLTPPPPEPVAVTGGDDRRGTLRRLRPSRRTS